MTLFHINNRLKRAIFFVLFIASILIMSSCGSKKGNPENEGNTTEQTDTNAAPDTEDAVQPPSVSQEPGQQTEATAPSPSPLAEVTGPDVPEREAVTDDYFTDAAFMGNSLMDGFRLFSGLTTCDYYAATSMTVVGADSKACITLDNGNSGTLVDGLTQKPYGKIYILLGINEIGYDVNTFIDLYGKMLDTIIAAQPDCNIYIMGLTPVSAAKSSSSETFNMTHINEYNTALHQLAADKGCYYLDLVSALAGPDGFLPADQTTDGVHFSAAVYKAWLNYVKTHYV